MLYSQSDLFRFSFMQNFSQDQAIDEIPESSDKCTCDTGVP